MTADLAHRSGDDDAGDDDDPDGGPGGPLAIKTRQLRRTSGFRGVGRKRHPKEPGFLHGD